MPDVLNVSPTTYVSLVGFVVTVMPVNTGSETVILNDTDLPPYEAVTLFVPEVVISGELNVRLLDTSTVFPLLYTAVTFMPLLLKVSPTIYEVFEGGLINVRDDNSSLVTVILKLAVLPAYVTVTGFTPAVLISGFETVTLLVTSAVVLLS